MPAEAMARDMAEVAWTVGVPAYALCLAQGWAAALQAPSGNRARSGVLPELLCRLESVCAYRHRDRGRPLDDLDRAAMYQK